MMIIICLLLIIACIMFIYAILNLKKYITNKFYEIDKNIKNYEINFENINDNLSKIDQELFDTIEVVMEPIDPISFYKLPEKGSRYAAAYDIYWSTANKKLNSDGSVTIEPGETVKFGTNLNIMITIDNFYLDICSRSGMSINKNLVVINSPARIDSDYRGELLIGIKNLSDKSLVIEPQSRIAQCSLHREVPANFMLGTVINNSDRGTGGLGHTGETKIN